MFFSPAPAAARLRLFLAFCLLLTGPLRAALTGPTLQFDYGAGQPTNNPLGQFMYFVPLISLESVSVSTNAENTQSARMVSWRCRTNGATFHVVCEFEFTGDGVQRNAFDHALILQRRAKDLQAGKTIAHQLAAISVEGAGGGSVEIDGTLTNGLTVTEMRLRFNGHGRTSPVNVDLQDLTLRDGKLCYDNEIVARVNQLTFRPKQPPKMEVTLASVKNKNAGNGLWQNFVGEIKGAAANLLLPPINITTNGNQAMLNFGRALVREKPAFTFPFATRLTNGPPLVL